MRRIILLALCLLPCLGQDGDVTFAVSSELVRYDVTVVDQGRVVDGLRAEDFVLIHGDEETPVAHCDQLDTPLDLLLLFDASGSMRPFHAAQIESARRALTHLRPGDRLAMIVFGQFTHTLLRLQDSRKSLHSAIKRVEAWLQDPFFMPGTEVNQSLRAAVRHLRKEGRPGTRRAIVLLTDNLGRGYASENTVLRELLESGAILYSVQVPFSEEQALGIAAYLKRKGNNSPYHPASLLEFTQATGGERFTLAQHDALGAAIERARRAYSVFAKPSQGVLAGLRITLAEAARARHPQARVLVRQQP